MADDPRGSGLRLQILVALSALMVLAFVPLYGAVASLTEAALRASRDHGVLALGRVVASQAMAAAERDGALLPGARDESVLGVCVVASGATPHCSGPAPWLTQALVARLEDLAATGGPPFLAENPPLVLVGSAEPAVRRAALVAVRAPDEAPRAAPLVRLVGLYTALFALALLTFTYLALTRVIVRPIDALAQAADRVARGARSLAAPRRGPREVAALGVSLETMTARLVAEEEALRAKVDELTRTTRRLTDAQAQLVRSERLASVGRLASGLAHEIGNPLAALLGLEDLLLDGELSASEQRDFLTRMKRETERIHGVLRDLLDFARPEARASSPAARADVAEVIDDVLTLLRPQRAFRDVMLTVDLPEAPVAVAMDRDKLTQVILNLCLNAGDALGNSGDGAVHLRLEAVGGRARIVVEDTGPGVEDNLAEAIFEPFFTTKEVGQGTGLGLSVCRGLVEGAGGTITLDASYRGGARFVIELPMAP